jgi:hypothetical protein
MKHTKSKATGHFVAALLHPLVFNVTLFAADDVETGAIIKLPIITEA